MDTVKYYKSDLFYLFMALNNIFLKFFILNSSYVTVLFQGVMVQLAPRVTVRKTSLGIQLRTLTGSR